MLALFTNLQEFWDKKNDVKTLTLGSIHQYLILLTQINNLCIDSLQMNLLVMYT